MNVNVCAELPVLSSSVAIALNPIPTPLPNPPLGLLFREIVRSVTSPWEVTARIPATDSVPIGPTESAAFARIVRAWVRPSELKGEVEFATQIEQTANREIATDLDFNSRGERFCLLNEYRVAVGISSVLHELVELLRHVAGIHQQEHGAIQAHFRNEIAGWRVPD